MTMNYNPDKHHRRSIRLKGYDYRSASAYYVTICCHQKQCLLGEIANGIMHPNLSGKTVQALWNSLPHHFPFIELDAFVVMPNHIHGIIVIADNDESEAFTEIPSAVTAQPILPCGTKSGSLGAIIQNFKSVASRRVNRLNRSQGTIWQRDYYEVIIRNEKAYENIRQYILENPLKWDKDEENPINFPSVGVKHPE